MTYRLKMDSKGWTLFNFLYQLDDKVIRIIFNFVKSKMKQSNIGKHK